MTKENLSPTTLKLIDSISTGKRVSGRLINQIPETDCSFLKKTYKVESVLAGIFCLAKNISPPTCFCGNRTAFNSVSKGFRQFCSVQCSTKFNNQIHNSHKNKIRATEFKDSIENVLNLCANEYSKLDNLKSVGELADEYNIPMFQLTRHLRSLNLIVKGNIHKKRHDKKMLVKYPELFDESYFIQEQTKNKNSKILAKELTLSPNTLCVYAKKLNMPFKNNYSISSAEFELTEFLGEHTQIDKNSRKLIPPYEIDLYLPEYKIGIEYNGAYWHSEQQGKDKTYHLKKQELAEQNGIKLIQIFDFEWLNRKEQIKGYLNSILNRNITPIYARKTSVKLVDKSIVAEFLNENHIHGNVNSKYNFGLYVGEELVSILTLGKSRFTKKYDYEVLRYCNKIGVRVIGGLSKLISYIKSNLEFNTIVSYSHRRLFDGHSFIKAGFKLSHKTKPGYFWANKNSSEIIPRYKTQKHKLNTTLTENEYMTALNYVKIWDCGQLVFILHKDINT